ncbi:uncharacterized protein At1g08160-like [Humulus lupulus]|uniref:uncharacterized protein At1g08160-like n=1 Tax=Humulus lupulus TaxID=3486 RepID=UPI002B408F88|nr:uncharacterized protein At1g08160-like [Humulus lupulus]
MENPPRPSDDDHHKQTTDLATKPPTRPESHILISWLATLVLVLIVVAGVAVLIIWPVLNPKRLVYSVEDSSVPYFHISNDNHHLNASFNFTVRSYNPNSRISIYYDSIQYELSYHDQALAVGAVDPFFQPKDNATRFSLTADTAAASKQRLIIPSSISADLKLQKKLGKKVGLDLNLNGKIRFKVGVWKSSHRTLTIVCPSVWVDFSEFKTFSETNCVVKRL